MEPLYTVIAFLYAGTGVATVAGYALTINDLMKKKESANVHSYLVWTACTGISFLYVLIATTDFLLHLIIGLSFVSCATILVLALNLKYSQKRQTSNNPLIQAKN